MCIAYAEVEACTCFIICLLYTVFWTHLYGFCFCWFGPRLMTSKNTLLSCYIYAKHVRFNAMVDFVVNINSICCILILVRFSSAFQFSEKFVWFFIFIESTKSTAFINDAFWKFFKQLFQRRAINGLTRRFANLLHFWLPS